MADFLTRDFVAGAIVGAVLVVVAFWCWLKVGEWEEVRDIRKAGE